MAIFMLLLVLVPIIIFIVKWLHEKNKYWERLNVKHLKPKLLFGNSYEALIGAKHSGEIIESAYLKFPDEEVVGFYEYVHPLLIVRSPRLVEKVLVTDFKHFSDRVKSTGSLKNPLSANLFNMCGTQWRAFRTKLSPLFTTQKLKYMYGPLSDCGENLLNTLNANDDKEVDVKEVMSLFSMDVIGSCAFGIDPGVLQNPSSKFREMGKNIFSFDAMQYFRVIFLRIAPKLANKLNITIVRHHIMKYFCDIILNTLEFRKKNGVKRNDFVQMLMELKESGKIEMQIQDPSDDYLRVEKNIENYEIKLTDELLMGTAFGFLSAGFHTTAMTLTYALYEIAQRPDILEQVKREIRDQVAVHRAITFDALKCMIYLEKVIKETMRLHPAALYIARVCTKTYTFPSGLTVVPGDSLVIPVLALHRDPFIYEDSYSFNPNRFDSPPAPGTYLPFGDGPRTCIGMRFAVLKMKYALSKILLNYDIELSKKTKIPVRMDPRLFLNAPKDEVLIRIKRRLT